MNRQKRALSIQMKLALLVMLFLCIPLPVSGYMWYQNMSETMEKNAVHYSQELVYQVNGHLDFYFSELERSTLPFLIHPVIQTFLRAEFQDNYEQYKITQRIQDDLFPGFIYNKADVIGVSIISDKGAVAQSNSTVGFTDDQLYGRYKRLIGERPGPGPVKNMSYNQKDGIPMITINRTILDSVKYGAAGMIVIDLNLNTISRITDSLNLGTTGYLWMMDEKGQLIYHPRTEGKMEQDPTRFLERMTGSGGYFFDQSEGEKRLYLYQRSSVTNWLLVAEVPLQEAIGSLVQMRDGTIWIGLVLIVLCIAIVGSFSFYLTHSLSHLQRLMKRAENGDLHVRAPERKNDEIGSLNRSFNKMVGEIQRLFEVVHKAELKEKEMEIRERDSTLMALQSQINPHFLYNTLEVINSHAIVSEVPAISHMATSLAKMLRYSIGGREQIVTLKDELDHIGWYLDIQKERCPSLIVRNHIDPEAAKNVQAVRLTIQPLVENAFIHGYQKHKLFPDTISLSGEAGESEYVLRIADRGKGMGKETMDKLNRAFAGEASIGPAEHQEGAPPKGIGLWNVHYRLALLFGEGSGLHIERSDESGTIIRIKLPYADRNRRPDR